MTTQALDAIARLDDGLAEPGDVLLADIFDRHASGRWLPVEQRLDAYAADRCVICSGPGGPECDPCAADWDQKITRSNDV